MGAHPKIRQPCALCGGEKPPGVGRIYCDACQENAQWKAARRTKARAVLRRGACDICGGKKEPGHGRRYCLRCKQAMRKRRRCMSCPAEVPYPQRKCQSCKAKAVLKKRAYEQERHRRNRAAGKYVNRKRRRKSIRERERQRIDRALRAEREGRTIKSRVDGLHVKTRMNQARHNVPIAPLLPYLRQQLVEMDVTVFGEIAHVRPHDISRMLEGHLTHVRFAQADRMAVALGLHVDLIYDEAA